jgi:hypothetical protein
VKADRHADFQSLRVKVKLDARRRAHRNAPLAFQSHFRERGVMLRAEGAK